MGEEASHEAGGSGGRSAQPSRVAASRVSSGIGRP